MIVSVSGHPDPTTAAAYPLVASALAVLMLGLVHGLVDFSLHVPTVAGLTALSAGIGCAAAHSFSHPAGQDL